MIDIGAMFGRIITPIVSFFGMGLKCFFVGVLLLVLCLAVYFFVRYRFNPFRLDADRLRQPYIKAKYFDLARWFLVDFLERDLHKDDFSEFGMTVFTGRQGTGKTLSMVHRAELIKERFPDCIIVSNFGYYRADFMMESWRDFFNIRNGEKGVLFLIDEIHSEFSSKSSNDFPESLLSEISQERKQRVKILCSSQFYTRMAKPLREQATTVVTCSNFLGRLMKNREYDAIQYALAIDNPISVKRKLKALKKYSFVASDALRACYDTFEKIKRMEKVKFIPRTERD